MPRSLEKFFTGHVSKTALLTLLPVSFASFFGTVITAAIYFPERYDWRVRVISNLTSPHDNPRFYWLPSLGIAAAMLLLLPFAGYVEQRLRAIAPRTARSAGAAFAFGFSVLFCAVVAQLAQPLIGMGWLHEFLARAAAGAFAVGMVCCSLCALKDRFDGQSLLCNALAYGWASLTLLPVICLVAIGALVLLGHQLDVAWAENLRQSFRTTPMWHLAFWEWAGAVAASVFLTVSAWWLPARIQTPA